MSGWQTEVIRVQDMCTVGVNDHYGQLMNYDNSVLAKGMAWSRNKDMYSEGSSGLPAMNKVHTKLSRYIIRSIDEYGLVIYSIGYVRGKVNQLIRVVYR